MKRVASIQDISCLGRCSLTVALPVLSVLGVECAVIPTAVLSTHTIFPDFTCRDLTDELLPIARHWQSQQVHLDALCSGYLASPRQTEAVCQVVLTGVSFDEKRLGAMSYNRETDRYFSYFNEKVPASFHGTGDIFTATVLGGMMQGRSLEQAVALAVDFTLECIRCTRADPEASWYGVEFEKALPWLARRGAEEIKQG